MEWWKLAIGFVVAAGIGVGCRVFGLPVPAPPTLYGALLILAITLGFSVTDQVIKSRTPATIITERE